MGHLSKHIRTPDEALELLPPLLRRRVVVERHVRDDPSIDEGGRSCASVPHVKAAAARAYVFPFLWLGFPEMTLLEGAAVAGPFYLSIYSSKKTLEHVRTEIRTKIRN